MTYGGNMLKYYKILIIVCEKEQSGDQNIMAISYLWDQEGPTNETKQFEVLQA